MFSLLIDSVQRLRKKAEATQLVNLDVWNIALVKAPANRRKFLLMKADGSTEEEMGTGTKTGITAEECRRLGDLLIDSLVAEVRKAQAPQKTAVDELEALVTERIHANPALTREVVVGEIYRENPDLYQRVRNETTVAGHGKTLREIYDKVEVHGIARKNANRSALTEVDERIAALMAKSGTAMDYTAAQAAVFAADHAAGGDLYERARTEGFA